jgi:membrane protein involved in colicin uptake
MKLPNPTLTEQTDKAVARVGQAANQAWKDACYEAIKEACRRWDTFTSEDVNDILDELEVHTHEPRAMGAMMRKAQADGYCQPTSEFVPSHRTTSNSYTKRVWKRRFIPNRSVA